MHDMIEYIIEETKKLLSIHSPSGFTREAVEYAAAQYRKMGYSPQITVKGGILVDLGGEKKEDAILLEAHIDTLGAMIKEIKSNGRLCLTPVGGLQSENAETENCIVKTKFNGDYEGTFQLTDASVHVNDQYKETKREFKSMEVILDEIVNNEEDTRKLGIMPGDFVCFEPRTRVTKQGFLKSRFLDDKLSVGILLGYARYLKEENITTERNVYQYITVYEEVGHGGAASIPQGVTEVLAVDMGCVGEGLQCDEFKVSICAKDSSGPYNYEVVTNLIKAAQERNLNYAVDIYPHYGSDADTALVSGHDVKHGLIGPGVYASHGYERAHIEGIKNTYELLKAYIKEVSL